MTDFASPGPRIAVVVGRLPVHQAAETVRHATTSDRNFYDRYYFNCHADDGSAFLIFGLGQYPNLAVQDAFVCVVSGDDHRVVRASRELGDRMDTSVGPLRVEVIRPLHELRIVCEQRAQRRVGRPAVGGLHPRWEPASTSAVTAAPCSTRCGSPRPVGGPAIRGGTTFDVTPTAGGARDRSWGIRPSARSRRASTPGQMTGVWNYAMQFEPLDPLHPQEHDDGHRGTRRRCAWND